MDSRACTVAAVWTEVVHLILLTSLVQVLRGLSCTLVSVAVQLGLGCKASNLYGRRANYRYLVIRGVLGALAMSADYFGLQYLAFGDAVSSPAL